MLNGSYPSLGRSQPLGRDSQITMVQTPSVEVLLEDKRSWLWWWHRIAGPPELPASASFKQRDQVRRGRLASTILFWVTILLIIVMPVGIFGSDHIIFPLALGALIVAAIAVYCNRRGWINVVGILLALSLNGSIALSIIKNPGGLSPSIENSFDLLVFGDVFVVSLLAPGWVVVSALCNIAFIIFEMLFAPRTPLFRTVAATDLIPLITRPIEIQMIVSAVLWLWVRNATEAIKRADRAELIAQLERSIAERDRAIILQKKQLEHSIRQVEYLLEQIANGNLDARLALNENNVLWSIVGKLNNLLSRYKQSLRAQRELQGVLPRVEKAVWMEKQHQRLVATIQNLQRELQRAHSERRSLHVASLQRGTLLDPLIRDLNGKYISEVPPRETFKLNSTLV